MHCQARNGESWRPLRYPQRTRSFSLSTRRERFEGVPSVRNGYAAIVDPGNCRKGEWCQGSPSARTLGEPDGGFPRKEVPKVEIRPVRFVFQIGVITTSAVEERWQEISPGIPTCTSSRSHPVLGNGPPSSLPSSTEFDGPVFVRKFVSYSVAIRPSCSHR